MFIEYKYHKVIDPAILQYLHTQMADGKQLHKIIHNNRNTMKNENTCIQNRSETYIQSIVAYFQSIINKAAKFLQETNIIET